MKKKLILLISNLKGGGAQRVVSNLSKYLAKKYHLYICLHDAKNIIYPYSGQLIDLKTPPANSRFKKAVNILKRISKFKVIRKGSKPDFVLSFMESSNLINLFSGRSGKTVISIRNYKSKQDQGFTGKVFNLLMKLFYNKSNKIVVVSGGIKADLVLNYGLNENKITVIYNPVDLEYIREMAENPLENQYASLFKDPVILTAGKMMRQKGQWHLIRAFSLIKRTIPNIKLVILGDGVLRSYLVSVIENLGLEDDIKLLCFQENPFKLFNKASLFVLPSLFEGFPNVLLEAMALGLPVIASDCPTGPREILAPYSETKGNLDRIEHSPYGVLVPTCSGEFYTSTRNLTREEKLLANAVIELYSNPTIMLKYRNASLSRAGDFSLAKIAEQWVELIESQ